MKPHHLLILILFISITLGITPALAQTTPTPRNWKERREAIKAEMKAEREEWKEKRDEYKDAVRAESQERRSEGTQRHGQRLEQRFGRYGNRLNNLISRLQKRIDALKAEGKDLSVTQAKLDEAKVKLKLAKELGTQAITQFKAIDPDSYDTQRDKALAARDVAQQARTAFLDALKLIKQVRDSLKGTEKS